MNPVSVFIDITNLCISYPDRSSPGGRLIVLDDLNLCIPKGEFASIIGPNGCGKTTLLLCLAGLLRPDSGTVSIGGVQPGDASCGYVFQNYRESLFPWLRVLDNIAFPLTLQALPRRGARERARDLIRRLAVNLPVERFPYELSGGQQQMTAILRAVIHEPAVLLLDEPFGSLDATARVDLRDSLQQIWRALGATTVFVSHDLDEAIYLADRVLALTPRPARIHHDVPVKLPRPRSWTGATQESLRPLRECLAPVVSGGSSDGS